MRPGWCLALASPHDRTSAKRIRIMDGISDHYQSRALESSFRDWHLFLLKPVWA